MNPTAAEAADKIIGILECLKEYDLVKTITADNGLVRQYIPKGSDFTNTTQEFLEEVEKKLNERPRKRHGFLSPDAVFSKMTGLDAGKFV